jgi:hypothetical protein
VHSPGHFLGRRGSGISSRLIRVNIEHHQSGIFLHDYELVGVSQQDAEALQKSNNANTAEKGFLGVGRWMDSWPDPKIPQDWLKATRPDLYAMLYPADRVLPQNLEIAKQKLTTENVGKAIQAFVDKHPEINPGIFWGSGDWIASRMPWDVSRRSGSVRRRRLTAGRP